MASLPSAQPDLPGLLLRNRNFVLLWAAYGISAFGDHLSEMALLQEGGGFARDDITRVQALMTFGFFLPFVLFGPLAGWWADRFSRKWTMIAADVLRAAVVGSIPLAFALPGLRRVLDDPASASADYLVALPLALTGLLATFFSPSRQAMVPTLIRDDQLVRANAMISALGTIGAILSGYVGGQLVDWALARGTGLEWNYWGDALTFLASAVLLAGIAMGRTRAVPHKLAGGVWTPLRAGFRYVREHRRVLQMILLGTVFWAAAGVVISVVPAIVRDIFGGSFSDVGMYRALLAAGLALGAGLLTLVGPALPVPLAVLAAVGGGALWVLALDGALVLKLGRVFTGLCLLMIGVHGAGVLVTIMVVIQRFVPDSRRGRVFGVSDMCTMAAITAATGLLGLPHIPHLDVYIPGLLAATAAGLLLATVAAWRVYRRGDRHPAHIWLLWQVLRFYVRLCARVRRIGPCTIPREGPVLLAANHTCGIDPVLILATSPHRLVGFVVARQYYRAPLAGWFMRQVDCVPIDRENPTKSFLAGALRHLRSGGCLGIFPQGTYVAPDEEQPGPRPGVGVLALRSGAPVIPCHISGTRYSYNPFGAYFRRHKARIRYGRPVDLSALRGREREKAAPQQAAELIMRAIEALGPETDGHGR